MCCPNCKDDLCGPAQAAISQWHDSGDDASLVEFLRKVRPMAVCHAEFRGAERGNAAEFVDPILCQLWKWDPSKGCVLAWIKSSVRNAVYSWWRRPATKLTVSSVELSEHEHVPEAGVQVSIDIQVDARTVRSALGALSDPARFVISEFYANGSSTKEIAQALHVSLPTARECIVDAVWELSKLLKCGVSKPQIRNNLFH